MSAQREATRHTSVDLSVRETDYYGHQVSEIENAHEWGLTPTQHTDLYRVQYLYLMVFGNSKSSTDYGGIQVRGKTHLYLDEGRVPIQLQRVMQRAAHRGAFLFDSGIETTSYGPQAAEGDDGGKWGDPGGGYLSGFTPTETGNSYRNWEVEPVGSAEGPLETKPHGVQPGKIEWTTEVYLEVDGTEYADLSGVAQGVSDPYSVAEVEKDRIESQDEWWYVTWNGSKGKYGSYDIHPPGHSASKERAKRIHQKDVYLNGLHIGTVVIDGRVWLAKEYHRGMTNNRGHHSKESIVAQTSAFPQSIRGSTANPGKLAKIDESPSAVHLATKGVRPGDFDPVDPDDVDPDLTVQEGGTVHVLQVADPEDATRQICRQDTKLIKHLGYSNPPYEHAYDEMWEWPGFRPIAEYGTVQTPEDLWPSEDRPDDSSLNEFIGGDE